MTVKVLRRVAVAAGAGWMLGALPAPMAMAQEPAPWIKMTATSGCTFFLYDYDDQTGTWQKQWPWTWTGACVGGVASGPGDLTAMMRSDSDTYSSGYRGTMVGGFLNGRVEEIRNGKMLADYYWQTFEMGCGSAAQFVYCKPASVGAAQPVPPRVTTTAAASPPPPARVGGDASAILTTLGVADEDRVFAMLAELLQTGQIDLAREAQLQLSKRFPGSPLGPVATQLINAMAQPQAAAPTPAPAPVGAVGATGGRMAIDEVVRIVEAAYGPAKNIGGDNPAYEFTVPRDGIDIPLVAEVSPNTMYVWVSARLTTKPVPTHTAALALQRINTLQPTMMWEYNGLRLGLAMDNRGLTAEEIRRVVDQVAADVIATRDLWGQ